MSWERWENHELGRQERCVTGMRWQVGKGEGIVRWHSWRGGKVVRWQIPCFLRGWWGGGAQGETKISSFCF